MNECINTGPPFADTVQKTPECRRLSAPAVKQQYPTG